MTREAGGTGETRWSPICLRRAFLAYLARHAPRFVALADFFSILLKRMALKSGPALTPENLTLTPIYSLNLTAHRQSPSSSRDSSWTQSPSNDSRPLCLSLTKKLDQ